MKSILEHISHRLSHSIEKGELETVSRAICMELLGISQTDYFLKSRIDLSDSSAQALDRALDRLAAGEPLQYVLGTAPFAGLEFHVDGRVLIPRPETAEMVELILRDYPGGSLSLLDVGTGSGCIAISLSKRRPGWQVRACDISRDALQVAAANSQSLGTHVEFMCMDILNPDQELRNIDVIVSNPPYITLSERADMEHTVLDFEPELALFVPDTDPLRFYRATALYGQGALRDGGAVYFEINPLFATEMVAMLESTGYTQVETHRDIFGKERKIKATYHGRE